MIMIALSLKQIRAMTDVALRTIIALQEAPGPPVTELTRTRIEIELRKREERRPK